jgi:hypothetical protein
LKIGEEDCRKNFLLSLYWFGKSAEVVEGKDPRGCQSLTWMAFHLDVAMRIFWHHRPHSSFDSLPGYSHVPFYNWALTKGGQFTVDVILAKPSINQAWKNVCANCGNKSRGTEKLKHCACCKAFHYCNKKCQVEHWKDGHKVDCKGHWIEEFFPNLRKIHD